MFRCHPGLPHAATLLNDSCSVFQQLLAAAVYTMQPQVDVFLHALTFHCACHSKPVE